jgi:DNA-binding transcriptional MerR regulator
VRALRFYEKRGLISPRRKGRVRIYGQVDSHRVSLIRRVKKLGFTLAEAG